MKKSYLLLLPTLLVVNSYTYAGNTMSEKRIVGPLETIHVADANFDMVARIDTGAARSSINVTGIKVIDPDSKKVKDNLGKRIKFTIVDTDGTSVDLEKKITQVIKVRNAQGVEWRYGVTMDLGWNGEHKEVKVNLRDRSKMNYKLLIGRDWLTNDYLVDVDKKDEDDNK
ncbi:RimK/LysX family protein [Vibrio sp. SS-MA-C1-2]|uniref:putative ATP-dependent zinc protease n=1 Tax=Vibrio sp. SS-MA-C1-2 TaxID=2908646 RepID=UPI001F1F3947|nr:RimK/LysX family protein [Vibrio sp. SS-MA-C1-2]UJF17300.1 RimK/LysX family protein [Vibrio sp. SS-MA-C1-2]